MAMSTDNPYAGTDNESQWQAGYDSGIASPGGIPDTPLVLESDQATIWSEGALAGFTDGQQQGFQAPLNPTGGEQPESIVKVIIHAADTTLEAGITISEIYKMIVAIGKGTFEVGALPISIFLLLLSVEQDPPPTFTDELQSALLNKCREIGQTEVFTALCRHSDHSDTGDWFLDRGYWHGTLNFSYTPSFQEAEAHLSVHTDAAGDVGVAHFITSAADDYEFLIVQ
jgi:hypothetical protein